MPNIKITSNPAAKTLTPRSHANLASKNHVKRNELPLPKIELSAVAALFKHSGALARAQEIIVDELGKTAYLLPEKSAPIQSYEDGDSSSRPGVYFLSGVTLDMIDDFGAMRELTNEIEGSRHYSWRQQDEILSDILGRDKSSPIILVGHGFGGDSAYEVAKKLDGNNRKVDLLVTIDSVGFDNDIIPVNVKKNINFIGEQDLLLNDSANIANDYEKTEVENILLKGISHHEIKDDFEVQDKIINEISFLLAKYNALLEKNN